MYYYPYYDHRQETIARMIARYLGWTPCPWTNIFGTKIEPIEDEL